VSLRDLVRMMLVVSDNAATDAVLHRVGLAAVNATAAALGLTRTVVASSLRDLVDSIGRDAGYEDWERMQAAGGRAPSAAALVPDGTTRTTARDMATLVRLIWRDEAGPADGCALLRKLMAEQATRHRLASGFGDGVTVAAKSGSLLGVVRTEIGVVEYPDGGRYAVAVFTRADEPHRNERDIDRAIGESAALAVDRIRRSSV
jgi:beta-lactamase class A